MRRCGTFLVICLLFSCLVRGRALAQARLQTRVSLDAGTIVQALSSQGFPVDRSEVEVPDGLSTATGEPKLRVTAADLLPDGRVRVRLSCAHAGECQPFLVTVHTATRVDGLHALATLQDHVPTGTPSKSEAVQSSAQHLLAGSRITLLMEDAHMRIILPVVAIDSGVSGAEIRVASLDRKQTFHAVVTDAQTVRGVLP